MSSAPPSDENPDTNPDNLPDDPLPDAEVDRRFKDLIGSLGEQASLGVDDPLSGPTATLLDATDTASVRGIFGDASESLTGSTPPWPDAGPRDYAVAEPEDEEGYTPPEPEPIEVREPKRVFAGLLALAPILVGIVAVFADIWLSTATLLVMAGCFIVGVVWFMLLLPHDRDPHDPGAVV